MRYDGRSMDRVLNIYKPQGMTPLQVIEWVRKVYPEYRDEKMTYAGRLDPMAEGVLLVLVGDAAHQKESYVKLDKVYEADMAVGLGTDTHDLLGIPTLHSAAAANPARIEEEVKKMRGSFTYPFPAYASKPVNGKPLFQWAREGRLDDITIPTRTMQVHGVELFGERTISGEDVQLMARMSIAKVHGDFRQSEILRQWEVVCGDGKKSLALPVVRLRIHCASGTYIRTLAHELGKRLGADAILLRLIRTRVGGHTMEEALVLDKPINV